MSVKNFYLRKIIFSDPDTKKIISEKTFDPPHQMDFSFYQINMDIPVGGFTIQPDTEKIIHQSVNKLKGEK